MNVIGPSPRHTWTASCSNSSRATAATRVHFAIALLVLALKPDPKAAIIPDCGPTALGTLRVLRGVEGLSFIFAEPLRRGDKAPDLLARSRAFNAQHTLMGVAVREDIEKTMP